MENDENIKPVENSNSSNDIGESMGYSIASLVLGILSICLFCLWYVSFPCAILAIIFGVIGKKKGAKGMATAGFVLGIVSIVLALLVTCFALAGVAIMGNLTSSISGF